MNNARLSLESELTRQRKWCGQRAFYLEGIHA